VVTPGSRFRDDLYVLYVVALLWFALPSYGRALALALPSDVHDFDRGVDLLAAGAGVIALWWGAQGGPLTISRAAVVHEMGSPASRIALLLPRLARQALTGGTFAAVAGTLLLALNGGASSGFAAPALISLVCGAAAIGAVFQAAIWLVVVHGHSGPRALLALVGALPPLAVAGYVASQGSLSSAPGLLVLAAAALGSGVLATVALTWVPVDQLWRRAAALESMRSAMQVFDFQRVLLDLRRAGDRPQPGRLRLARAWMPTALWRQLATMQHGLAKRLVRITAAGAALAALVALADARNGLVVLAIAGCGGLLGFELSGSLAATADQGGFVVHYRRGSASVLRAQLATMLGLSLFVGAVAVAWRWTATPPAVASAILLCGFGALGAALQARLGSPNLAAFVDIMGLEWVGPLLWARAMLGPVVLVVGTVALSRQVLRPPVDGSQLWVSVAIATAIAAAVIATRPLEKEAP
jgi:hypothetical protein